LTYSDHEKIYSASYESLEYEVPDLTEDTTNDTDATSVTESQSQGGDDETKPRTDEFGKAPRPVTTNQGDARPATITVDRASQTTNPVSSITQTNPYPQLEQYGMHRGAYSIGPTYHPAYAYAEYTLSLKHILLQTMRLNRITFSFMTMGK
jgi:hypothetical protein